MWCQRFFPESEEVMLFQLHQYESSSTCFHAFAVGREGGKRAMLSGQNLFSAFAVNTFTPGSFQHVNEPFQSSCILVCMVGFFISWGGGQKQLRPDEPRSHLQLLSQINFKINTTLHSYSSAFCTSLLDTDLLTPHIYTFYWLFPLTWNNDVTMSFK